jgi:hypothetical protein
VCVQVLPESWTTIQPRPTTINDLGQHSVIKTRDRDPAPSEARAGRDAWPEFFDPRRSNFGGITKVDPLRQYRDFGEDGEDAIRRTQEIRRGLVELWLFILITGCLVFLAIFDLLMLRSTIPEAMFTTVNATFAGGAGILGLCATYILAPYKPFLTKAAAKWLTAQNHMRASKGKKKYR